MTGGQDPFSVSLARQWVVSARLNTHTHTHIHVHAHTVLSPCTDLLGLVSGLPVHKVSPHPAVNPLLPVQPFKPANLMSASNCSPFLAL